MNKEEAETLKPGEQVCIFAGESTACSGTIVSCNAHGVEIKWDDGRTGVVLYPVMLDVEHYSGPPILPEASTR
ncbi:MAG: hypothetical protein EPN75_00780 [Beijerinckiaceae bacterium]|nr:MAG: hypothetical protein EPN75_00780 [Beijerinckiaceae bacterium]